MKEEEKRLLKIEFCEWVKTNPIVEQIDAPTDLDTHTYFKVKECYHHRVEIASIPKKFMKLLGK